MRAWRVIHAYKGREQEAEINLIRQGFKTYNPLTHIDQRSKRIRHPRYYESMFPGYFFINLCDESEDWRPIRSTPGVISLVHFGDQFAIAPPGLIETLRSQEDQGVHYIGQHDYKPGDHVTVRGSALSAESTPEAQYEAIISAVKGDDRIAVLMNILGRKTHVTVSRQDIEPAT